MSMTYAENKLIFAGWSKGSRRPLPPRYFLQLIDRHELVSSDQCYNGISYSIMGRTTDIPVAPVYRLALYAFL